MKTSALFVIIALCLALPVAQAEIYRWVDADGTVHYGDQPRRGASPAELPDVYRADPVPTGPADNSSGSDKARADMVVQRVVITSPESEQTFREANGQVNVQVSVEPGLPNRAGIRYFVDGNPVSTETTRSSNIRVEGVTPGSHTVSASVVVNGSEVARAKPVVFYMRPPTAIKPLQSGGSGSENPTPDTGNAPAANQSGGVLGAPRAGAP